MAHHVVYQESDYDLTHELKKCKECSCSRCYLNGTPGCYIEIAVRELNRYEQAMDSLRVPVNDTNSEVALENIDHVK